MQVPPPQVGDWYRKPSGKLATVVAIDDQAGTVEMQHFDGTLEEVDMDQWSRAVVLSVEAPEDWSGSIDVGPEDGCQFDDDAAVSHRPYLNVMDYADQLD